MNLEFKKYDGSSASLEKLGTVKELAGKGGSLSFLRKNWNDPSKRVALVIKRADNTSAVVACSKQVSEELRAKRINIGHLAGFDVVGGKNANGQEAAFVAMPATGAVQTIALDEVKVTTLEQKAESFMPSELVAF